MRTRIALFLPFALVIAAITAAGLVPGGGHAATAKPSDFIVRCFFNGNTAPEDPIMDPGSTHTDHLHVFLGNMASGGAAMNGSTPVPFPGITAGEDHALGTMENDGLPTVSNCQDTKDTAGYWVPEPFMVTSAGTPAPWLPGGAGGCSTNCNPNVNLHMRVYYLPHGSTPNKEIPDGSIMVAGYPSGCANVGSGEPAGCEVGGPSYPVDLNNPNDPNVPDIVQYSCGADTARGLATPHSSWPYDCTKYIDKDDSFSDGEVAFVNFPDCWNGKSDFPAPNSPANAQGLPTTMVPGYVAPWIPYTAWKNYKGLTKRPANDFAYASGGCKTGWTPVVQLEERLHLLTMGKGWGDPSTCVGDAGIKWNTLANRENSPTADDKGELGGGDGDATELSPGIFGPHLCTPPAAPTLTGTPPTVSFACSNPGDPECKIPLSSPKGCVTAGGTCFAGAYHFGWETLHADYWQTWQEASNNNQNLDTQPGSSDLSSDTGTLGDLVEDCADTDVTKSCAFITNTTPAEVYGPPSK